MNGTGFRVLVAEDEQTFGLTVTRFLQKAGHEVKICVNGKSVLNYSLTITEKRAR